jgi:hypothetical protein
LLLARRELGEQVVQLERARQHRDAVPIRRRRPLLARAVAVELDGGASGGRGDRTGRTTLLYRPAAADKAAGVIGARRTRYRGRTYRPRARARPLADLWLVAPKVQSDDKQPAFTAHQTEARPRDPASLSSLQTEHLGRRVPTMYQRVRDRLRDGPKRLQVRIRAKSLLQTTVQTNALFRLN